MADERPRMRQALRQQLRQRLRQRSQAAAGTAPAAGAPGTTPSGLSRRSLLGLVAGGAVFAAGAYEFWPGGTPAELPIPLGQIVGPEYLAVTLAQQPAPVTAMPSDGRGWSTCVASRASERLGDLDLVLAVDTTGSMGGVLTDVKVNLQKLVANLRAIGDGVRVGLVAYKDTCDREVIRPLPLTPLDPQGVAILGSFISSLQAGGGCDWPEKMEVALDAATSMAWRGDVPSSIVVIADAPAHPEDEPIALAIAQAFSTKIPGAQVSLVDTGSGGHSFMRALPSNGGGQYVTYDGRILNSLFPAISGCRDA